MHGKTRPAARSLFALVFAGVPQASRKTFWRLRESRKSCGKYFGVCGSPASLTENFLAFATLLQVSRKTFWRLQHCCKSHEKLSGICNTVASLTKNFLVFATLLQVSRKTFWRLQRCCKHFQKRFDPRVASVETLCRLYAFVELTFSICVFDVVPPSKSITADTDPCCYPECVLGSPSCVRWRSATSSW